MKHEPENAPQIVLLKSEMEAAAARVAERAGNYAVDGFASISSQIFGGLIGDGFTQWRNRNLVTKLARSKHHFDKLGIPIENAKALPQGELYAIFDGMSKQDDPQLSDMWSALLTNAMRPDVNFTLDPALPKILEQLSGVDAVILSFYHDADKIKQKGFEGKDRISRSDLDGYRQFINKEGEKITAIFDEETISSSIGSLLRLGLFYVESSLDDSSALVRIEYGRSSEAIANVSELKDELSNIYYRLNLSYDNVEMHKLTHYYNYGEDRHYFLPYDLTRLASRLVSACKI